MNWDKAATSLRRLTRRELYSRMQLIRRLEPIIDDAFMTTLRTAWRDQTHDSPHGHPWHTCLSADTEVVTRQGIIPISEAVGVTELLVPEKGRSCHGRFMACEVASYGVAPTLMLTLRRHKQIKVVTCTPNHRWVLTDGKERRAEDIVVGDEFRPLRATVGHKVKPTPFAFPQGFVFGDGTRRLDGRPCHLNLFHNGKDEAMLPFFAGHETMSLVNPNGVRITQIRSLPRLWKELPSYSESRSFLLSWLAGYFAADGCVDDRGYSSISSSSYEHIAFARDVLAICGVAYGKVTSQVQSGTYPHGQMYEGRISYSIRFSAYDLPMWFFLTERHRERVAKNAHRREGRERAWKVVAIDCAEPQEVFCATVPEHGVFGLADQLMTGNSYHASQFPGDDPMACPRQSLYRMMDLPSGAPPTRWLMGTANAGKAIEVDIVKALHTAGLLISSPPDSPIQTGFEIKDLWFTGSIDSAILLQGKPTPIEIKCLAGETEVLTRQGVRRIRDLAGQEVEVLNGRGFWQKVPFEKYGKDRLLEIHLQRGKTTKSIFANADHRWFVTSGSTWVDTTKGGKRERQISKEVLTKDLLPGMKLTRCTPRNEVKKGQTWPSPIGIARGLVYGDGSLNTSGGGANLDLFDAKNLQLLKYFPENKLWALKGQVYRDRMTDGGTRVTGFPKSYKVEKPSFDEGVSYLYGWLAGYFAADGTVSKNGNVRLDSVDRASLEYFRDLCTALGITTKGIFDVTPHSNTPPSGITLEDWRSYYLIIESWSLTEDFFIIEEQRLRWLEWQLRAVPSKRQNNWVVQSVEMTDRIESLYCAVVKGSEKFVLDGFILTGNTKHEDVIAKMKLGMLSPDDGHIKQVKTEMGLIRVAQEAGDLWPDLELCDRGYIYYQARDSPFLVDGSVAVVQTAEFMVEYDPKFFDTGLEVLREWKRYWEEENLPSIKPTKRHPNGWRWSYLPCRYCDYKRICKADHLDGIDSLEDSTGIEYAKSVRPDYSYNDARQRVKERWAV